MPPQVRREPKQRVLDPAVLSDGRTREGGTTRQCTRRRQGGNVTFGPLEPSSVTGFHPQMLALRCSRCSERIVASNIAANAPMCCCSLPWRLIAAVGVFLPIRLAVARASRPTGRNELKSYEEIMEILEAYDLTGSFRAAAELPRSRVSTSYSASRSC